MDTRRLTPANDNDNHSPAMLAGLEAVRNMAEDDEGTGQDHDDEGCPVG